MLNFSANINLNGINIAKEVSQKFDNVPVFIENDVNVGVIGEWKYGVGQGHENIVGIFAGTGIGGGLVINNQFLYGVTGGAGAVGHVSINTQGAYCQSCGSQGCVETYAGKVGMEKKIENLAKKKVKSTLIELVTENDGKLKSSHIKKALETNDEIAMDILSEAMEYLGTGLGSALNIINPSMVILGGGVMEAIGEQYLSQIKRAAMRNSFADIYAEC
ncbi:ROK family protein [Francisella noatunensis subsp. noatunensis]|nr:ROK family protein [Francisella noatunensis]NBH63547.1 ROK family protein [Francisella noatunensis subsp. noatunensis]QOG55520.1 ROK family protein [Francisella noatunensis subsp. noatunensis FSC774]